MHSAAHVNLLRGCANCIFQFAAALIWNQTYGAKRRILESACWFLVRVCCFICFQSNRRRLSLHVHVSRTRPHLRPIVARIAGWARGLAPWVSPARRGATLLVHSAFAVGRGWACGLFADEAVESARSAMVLQTKPISRGGTEELLLMFYQW